VSQSLLRQRILPDFSSRVLQEKKYFVAQSLLRQRILPDIEAEVARRTAGEGLNRFFVSEYFRTENAGCMEMPGCLEVSIASSSANTSGHLDCFNVADWQTLCLNRFFVSEYFRTTVKRTGNFSVSRVSIASSSANTSGRRRVRYQTFSMPTRLNRFFVSEYFRTVVWLMDIFRETMVSIASSSANTSGQP